MYRTETTEDIPEDAIFLATPMVGESTRAAIAAAEAWLAEGGDDEAAGPEENQDQPNNSEKDG